MSSNAARKRKEVMDGDRSEDSNDDLSEHGDQQQQQPNTRDRDTLPQSSSVTAVTTSTSPSLPSLAEAAAAAAPAPTASGSTKKSRRAGFREQFLQQLRVMLDRESQMNSTIVQWSTDGNSFIVMDQNQFEEQTIPTYFDNRIIFTSFLRKLNRWGFRRITRSTHTHYEFALPTFRRLGGGSAADTAVAEDDAPVPAHAAAAASAAIGGASASDTNPFAEINQQLPVDPPPLPQVGTIQANHQTTTAPNDYLPSQQASQATDIIAALLSNIMQRSNQQHSTPSQQSSTAANSILQGGNIDWTSIQHPSPTTNQLLGNAMNTFSAQQQQQPPQQLGASYHSQHHQANPLSALMSLVGMLPNQSAATNTGTTSTSQVAQSLLMLMHQVGEEDRRHRAQVEAIQSTLVSIIAVIISGQRGQMAAEYDRHRRISDLLEIVGRPNNIDALQNQERASTSTSAHLNVQAPRRDEAEDQGGGSRREFPNDDGDNSQYDADSDNDDDNE